MLTLPVDNCWIIYYVLFYEWGLQEKTTNMIEFLKEEEIFNQISTKMKIYTPYIEDYYPQIM